MLSAASQQYGGFTVPSADLILEPYAEKSYKYYIEKYKNIGLDEEKSKEIAMQILKEILNRVSKVGNINSIRYHQAVEIIRS